MISPMTDYELASTEFVMAQGVHGAHLEIQHPPYYKHGPMTWVVCDWKVAPDDMLAVLDIALREHGLRIYHHTPTGGDELKFRIVRDD